MNILLHDFFNFNLLYRFNFTMSSNQMYWQLANAFIVTNTSKDPIPLVYMGAPYGMETPLQYSFVCTRTVFQVAPVSNKGATSRFQVYVEHFQVSQNQGQNKIQYTFSIQNMYILKFECIFSKF
jgi:hypothetical protein